MWCQVGPSMGNGPSSNIRIRIILGQKHSRSSCCERICCHPAQHFQQLCRVPACRRWCDLHSALLYPALTTTALPCVLSTARRHIPPLPAIVELRSSRLSCTRTIQAEGQAVLLLGVRLSWPATIVAVTAIRARQRRHNPLVLAVHTNAPPTPA